MNSTSTGSTKGKLLAYVATILVGAVLGLLACGCSTEQPSQPATEKNPDEVLMHVRYGDEDIQVTRKAADDYITQGALSATGEKIDNVEDVYTDSALTTEEAEEEAAREIAGRKLVFLDAKSQYGMETGEDEIDAYVQQIADIYAADEQPVSETFEDYINEMYGYTMDEWREELRYALLVQKLAESGKLGNLDEIPDDFALDFVNNGISSRFDGLPIISCIVLDPGNTEAAAIQQQALADFDAAKAAYSTTSDYDGVEGETGELVDTYVSAAAREMKPGEVSDVIAGEEHLFIVKLIDVASVPEDGYSSMAEVPGWLKELFQEDIQESYRSKLIDDYVAELLEEHSV